MFERFTDRARRVLVLAQEEARLLNHTHIGTEHLLLGLIHEHEGVAAQALAQMDISLEAVREKVEETIALVGIPLTGSPPFTPRAKKVLELSLREALQMGHNYIGTEHILLGLVREGEGVACQVMVSLGVELVSVREQVVRVLSGYPTSESASRRTASDPWDQWTARQLGPRPGFSSEGLVGCSFCGRQTPETGQLFTGGDAFICEHCVRQWSEQLGEEDDSPDDE